MAGLTMFDAMAWTVLGVCAVFAMLKAIWPPTLQELRDLFVMIMIGSLVSWAVLHLLGSAAPGVG